MQFLYIALGSTAELETQLRIADRIGYTKTIEIIDKQLIPIKKMLNALIKIKKTT